MTDGKDNKEKAIKTLKKSGAILKFIGSFLTTASDVIEMGHETIDGNDDIKDLKESYKSDEESS